jgi:hypothetical protein
VESEIRALGNRTVHITLVISKNRLSSRLPYRYQPHTGTNPVPYVMHEMARNRTDDCEQNVFDFGKIEQSLGKDCTSNEVRDSPVLVLTFLNARGRWKGLV